MCSVEGCARPVRRVGLCDTCYARARRKGLLPDPQPGVCATCSAALQASRDAGRRFCSKRCLASFHNNVRHEAEKAERADRARAACALCGATSDRTYVVGVKFCSRSCSQRWHNQRKQERLLTERAKRLEGRRCDGCGGAIAISRKASARTCSYRCTSRMNEQRRRSRLAAAVVHVFTNVEVFDRDRWVCQICYAPIDPSAKGQQMASLDHVLPISLGGSHTLDNVQAAHLRCNVVKGARVEAVLG